MSIQEDESGIPGPTLVEIERQSKEMVQKVWGAYSKKSIPIGRQSGASGIASTISGITGAISKGFKLGGGDGQRTTSFAQRHAELMADAMDDSSSGGARRKFKMGKKDRYKNSGVKRVFILALIPNTPENYKNMEIILKELDLTQISYSIASDFKLINICSGLQNHR